jgi:isopenicillin-N epimerase
MWALEPGTHHLNHGSFGAVLEEVLDEQTEWRRRIEANPTRFVIRDLPSVMERSREAVSRFVGADSSGIVPVRNATAGVASVLRSVEPFLGPGDQILTTSHDYNAVRQILRFTAQRTGAELVVAPIPFPIADPTDAVDAILGKVTSRTRLAVVDHVTSSTALVLPVESVISALEPKIPVLVDGAHGPGQVPLELDRLGASWYTGNLHKWVCAPKGAAFLHTRPDRRDITIPTVISHGYNAPLDGHDDRYLLLFDWLGTDDFTAWAVVPDALDTVGSLEAGGWDAVMKRNHELVLEGRSAIADAAGTALPAPDEMVGAMAAVLLSDSTGPHPPGDLSPLMEELMDLGFVALVMHWPGWPAQLLRISAFLYNTAAEYRALGDALRT